MSDSGSTPPPPPQAVSGPVGGEGTAPPNYFAWGILTTLLCCPPFGITSMVFASQVNSKWASGDVAGAQVASARARKFAVWAALSAALAVLFGLFVIFGLHGLRAGK
jgi:Interferon-induced transmembrane protein